MPGQTAAERDQGSRAPAVAAPAFTGRDRELTELAAALGTPPAVVLVEGEAGIGKTRLVREYLASRSRDEGQRVLVGSCPPFRQPQTLGPVADAVRQATGEVSGLGLSGLAGALLPLFPEWAGDLPPAPQPAEDATAARYRLFAALAEVIDRLGVGLLVLEDAHWADEATLEFLLFLSSRPGGAAAPVSLVITSRPEDVPPGSLLPRLARLATGSSGLRITLGVLDVAATAGLVSSMLTGERLSEEFTRFVHEHTGGVPLAIEESVRLMATRADLVRRDGQWVRRELARLAVPPPVRDAVLERASRLGPDAQAVLRAAAVLGEPAAGATLSAATGFSAERLRAGLSDALASGLLADDSRGMVSFRHVLAARAVYESIAGPDRRLLHERAGQALARLAPAPVAALARHFREAGDSPAWLRYGEQAAGLALAAGDEATAAVLLHELITSGGLAPSDVARLAGQMILLALPGNDRLASLATALRTVLGTAGLPPSLEAELRFQVGRTLFTLQEADASRAELERAVAGLPPDSFQAVRAMMLLGCLQDSDRPAAEHLRWLRRAAAADASVPPAERLRLLVDRITALLLMGEQAGWSEAESIPWDAAEPRDRLQVIRAHGNIAELAMMWGRYAEARRWLEHAVALADGHHYARLRGIYLVTLAHLDWSTGAWDGLAERAAALAGDDDVPGVDRLRAIQVTGLLRTAAGDPEQACRDLSYVADETKQLGAIEYMPDPAAALARLHLARGDVTAALKATDDPIGIVTRKGTWHWAADLAPARVAALAAAGRLDEAATLTGALATGLRGRDIPAAGAGLALSWAILSEARGEHGRAVAQFARAAAAWQALPRPYDALLARERQARCLLATGRQQAGLAVLTEAERGLSGLGAAGDADRVARILREHGITVPRVRQGGQRGYGDRLSPRELEVVRLVIAGRTNPEIAEKLCRSRPTVATQLKSAMRKLGVSSRTALAVSAAATGITPDGQPHREGERSPAAR